MLESLAQNVKHMLQDILCLSNDAAQRSGLERHFTMTIIARLMVQVSPKPCCCDLG